MSDESNSDDLSREKTSKNDPPSDCGDRPCPAPGEDNVDEGHSENHDLGELDPGDGWVHVPRADWRDDAEFLKEGPEFLLRAKVIRLEAIGKLRKAAAEVLQRTKPQQQREVELCVSPIFQAYAESVFDKMAEAELSSSSNVNPERYANWLKAECLPEVVRDVYSPIFSQFHVTLRYVADQIGEMNLPADLTGTRYALLRLIADAILPERGSCLFNLETRLTDSLREERIPHWEAMAEAGRVQSTGSSGTGPAVVDPDQADGTVVDTATRKRTEPDRAVAPVENVEQKEVPPVYQVATESTDRGTVAKQARAATVAVLIKELNTIRPQMFEDEVEYKKLRDKYSEFFLFQIADGRPDLKKKVLMIRSSTRHIRLAQELAAARHGRALSTIQDDWKKCKPPEFKRGR